jgi:DNA-directed RNA polymerase specialized sigma24 family protein
LLRPASKIIFLKKESVSGSIQNLPQLYRFCFLMTGDQEKAEAVFRDTVRDAALRSSQGDTPADRLWIFREARARCLEATKDDLVPEPATLPEEPLAGDVAARFAQLEPAQLAVWISGAPEPQRSALALFYLDVFSYREILDLLELKLSEFAPLISHGRGQLQAWLMAVTEGEPA